MARMRFQLQPGDREKLARCLRLTLHALRRAAERDVSMTDIQYVLRHGSIRPTWGGLRFRLDSRHVSAPPSVRRLVVIVDITLRIPTVYLED